MNTIAHPAIENGTGRSAQFSADVPVYERLGDIIRALHDTLTEIGADNVLSEAASEFPSARERLQHIGNLTEKAANTVLNKVELTMPLQESLGDTAEKLKAEWDKSADHPLAERTKAYLVEAQEATSTTYQALSEIMMAQDFQDLTGQLIKKVVSLIERTENDLLKLLIDAAPPGTISITKKDELMAGPGAAGGIALEQSSVDDLLADLGF
ncbi:protein phosphatase CheZ [Undibacterium terreum]|uniref:Protein phosphatase CheZ n=1 Tax=Undibacterium terreum TaxID=1224302 RepID=A0A916U8R2_9BURK|nr:protein phosphatase CheZ [Undibacterium terreum]GGC62185.1 protein phosphatase CheZ [Undibacterium terreum]